MRREQGSVRAAVRSRRDRGSLSARSKGAAIAESVIALPVLLVVILGVIQFGLIYEAKATLNHASLQAARAGSVANADVSAIRRGLARGLLPLSSPDSSVPGVAQALARINASVLTDARIRILNPTREAFDDFGEDVNGQRELPNDRLHARSTVMGTRSGVNIQDANLLRIEVTYGVELQVPLVNWFLTRILLAADRAGVAQWDAFEQQLLRRTRLPTVATAIVRMQTPARLNDAMLAKADLPNLPRVPANDRPADDRDQPGDGTDEERDGSSQAGDEPSEHTLADGAFGFHGDHAAENTEGGGDSPNTTPAGGTGGATSNGGSPAQCSSDTGGGLHDVFDSPGGQSSPADPAPNPFADSGNSSAATLPGNSLPGLAVGNPIHVATGNKYQVETDLHTLPGKLGLTFSRHYNSEAVQHAGALGAGWRHAFEAELILPREQADVIDLIQADGRAIAFHRTAHESDRYVAQRVNDGTLTAVGNGFRWQWSSGRALLFDGTGKLTSIVERGERVALYYEGDRLVSVVDPQHRKLTFAYYANGRVARINGPEGFVARYRYDDAGNLAEALYADGTARVYRYEASGLPHHLTGIEAHSASFREFGNRPQTQAIAAWTYDSHGRAISSTHPDGVGHVLLAYQRNATEVTDAFGRITRYEYEWIDGTARVTAIRGPGCGSCAQGDVRYVYGAGFTVTEINRAHEPSYQYVYDDRGRTTEIGRTDLSGTHDWLVRYQYEGENALPSLIKQPSIRPDATRTTRVRFDSSGNPIEVTEQGYSRVGATSSELISRTHRFEFDEKSRLLSYDGPREDVRDITRYTYDDAGRLSSMDAPGGTSMRALKYDGAGRLLSMSSSPDAAMELEYDTLGRIKQVHATARGVSRIQRYEYDALGRPSTVIDEHDRARHLTYDAANRANGVRYSTGLRQQSWFTPDDLPSKFALATAAGQSLRTLYFAYDSRRRPIEVRDGDGPPLRQLRYIDADQRPDTIIDPLGAETRLTYDALGRTSDVHAPDGGVSHFEFDPSGHITSITAPNGAHTTYEYDDFGRRTREISPDRGTLLYRYDVADNVTSVTDARGITTRYEYDAANRLIKIRRPSGTSEFRYEGKLLVSISDPNSREDFRHDKHGRVIEHIRRIDSHKFSTGFEYDEAGRLAYKRLPSGIRLTYTHNHDGQLIGVSQARLFESRLLLGTTKQDPNAQPINPSMLGDVKLGNGLTTRTRLERGGRGTAYHGTDGVTQFSYKRDAAGRIAEVNSFGTQTLYSYDAVGRLISAVSGKETLTYAYDANGNRLSVQRTLGSATASESLTYASGSNRLISVTTHRFATHYRNDASGNLIRAGDWTYVYDDTGRLARLDFKNMLRAQYAYNASGERIRKDVFENGLRRRNYFLYESGQLIAEVNDQGLVTREYLYANYRPQVMLDGSTPYWIHTDDLGMPYAVTNLSQNVVWRSRPAPFGEVITEDDPDGDNKRLSLNLRFSGQYFDEESGFHQNGLRDYQPVLGRYQQSDPLGLAAGANTFAYVSSNPLSAIDPSGTYQQDVHYYMTFFLAVTVGFTPETARRLSLASAFVDENPFTRPLDGTNRITALGSILHNQPQLLFYHFVLSDPNTGRTIDGYKNSDVHHAFSSPGSQLEEMWSYATSAPHFMPGRTACNPDNVRLQFLGEYIHAFEDTYSHRDENNIPIDALTFSAGLGHGSSGADPDYTYNAGEWQNREGRTFSMEMDTRDMLRNSPFSNAARSITDRQLDTLFSILTEFNSIQEHEAGLGTSGIRVNDWPLSRKVARLNEGLRQLGYNGIDLESDAYRFDAEIAFTNRRSSFRDLEADAYHNAILNSARSN